MALTNTNFDGKLSALIPAWLDSNYTDLFNGHNPIFYKLRNKAKVQTGGFGTKLARPFYFPSTSGPQAAGVSDAYAMTTTHSAMDGHTSAEFTAAEYYFPFSIEEYIMDQHGSQTSKLNYVNETMEIAMTRFMNKLIQHFWIGEENAKSAGARDQLASIRTFLNGSGGTTTDTGAFPACLTEQTGARAVNGDGSAPIYTVGGINRNATLAAPICTPIINTAQTFSIGVLGALYQLACRDKDHPTLIIVTRELMNNLQNWLSVGGTNGGQIYSDSNLAKVGFDAVRYRGADVVVDDSCPIGVYLGAVQYASKHNAFAVNENHIDLVLKSKVPTAREYDDSRFLKTWKMRWVGQLTAKNLGRVHARHVNITPA